MPTIQYLPFANANNANVLAPSAYAARGEVQVGVVPGTADPALANTTWRQSSIIASAIAQAICDTTGLDMLDDGNVSAVVTKFKAMLAATLVTGVPPIYSGTDSSSNANTITATVTPSLTSAVPEGLYLVKMANTCAGATQMAVNGLPNAPVVGQGGSALLPFAYFAGDIVAFSWNGNTWTLLNDSTVAAPITISVSTVAQLQNAVVAASRMLLTTSASITISLAAGQYPFTSITGPLRFRHPFGDRLTIAGPALKASWPTAAQMTAAGSTSARRTLLLTILSVEFTGVGTDIIQLSSGGLGSLQNVLLTGDGTASGGHYGALIGNWSTATPGFGFTQFINVAAIAFGIDGIRAEQSSFIQMNNVAVTDCTRAGLWVSHYSVYECNIGNLLAMYNKYGVSPQNNGAVYVDSASGTVDFSYNTSHNVYLASMGKMDTTPSTGCRITYAGGWGVFNYGQGQCNLPASVTLTGNTSGDLFCGVASVTTAIGATVGICSPSANSGQNAQGAAIYK